MRRKSSNPSGQKPQQMLQPWPQAENRALFKTMKCSGVAMAEIFVPNWGVQFRLCCGIVFSGDSRCESTFPQPGSQDVLDLQVA